MLCAYKHEKSSSHTVHTGDQGHVITYLNKILVCIISQYEFSYFILVGGHATAAGPQLVHGLRVNPWGHWEAKNKFIIE